MEGSQRIVRIAVAEVIEIVRIAGLGAARQDAAMAQVMAGVHRGLNGKFDEIVEEVMKKL